MKTMAELQAIRDKMKANMNTRDSASEGYRVIVGMATCGIAAGARPVLNAFMEEVSKRGLSDVKITQAGCVGMCVLEPIVEVIDKNGEKTTYVHMNPEKAARVVSEHIVNGKPVADFFTKS